MGSALKMVVQGGKTADPFKKGEHMHIDTQKVVRKERFFLLR